MGGFPSVWSARTALPRLAHAVTALLELFLRMRALFALLFLDHAAVEEVDRAPGVLGEAGIVRDHADRRAGPVELLQQAP